MSMHNESLDWLAQQYVLGEMPADEAAAFEARLADDELAAAAVADAARLVMALEAAEGITTVGRPVGWSRGGWIAIGLAGLAAAVAIIALPRSGDDAAGRTAELAARWAEIAEFTTAEELGDDDDASVGDDVPDWLLAAVTLEQDGIVQEN